MREETLLAPPLHPEAIDGEWTRVDHPVLGALTDGEPTLGWEGDPRLVVYLHGPTQSFVLWRLEADATYRPVAHFDGNLTEASTSRLIRRLIQIDTRRGFDIAADVEQTTRTAERHAATDRAAAVAAFADKFHFALSRSHLPGVDIVRR